jgi:hypothetical protein
MPAPETGRSDVPGRGESAGRTKALSERLVIMLSHERSGSHFVADMLKSSAKLVSVDEVCNFNAVDPYKSKLSFFRFRHECQQKNPEFAYRPDYDNLTAFCDSYFAHLLSSTKVERVLVDIKYGHVHNFEIGWWPSESRPFLARYLCGQTDRCLAQAFEDRSYAIWKIQCADPEDRTRSAGVATRER